MRKKNMGRNKNLAVSAKMPPSYHKLPGQEYNPEKSEVLEWLTAQPELIEYLFSRANQAKEIVYDSETGVWTGVEYEGE